MSKKKLTDEEYLKFLNEELSRLNADNPEAFQGGEEWPEIYGQNADPSGVVSELKNLLNTPTNLSQERRRNTQDISGFGRAVTPGVGQPRGPLKLNPDGQGTFQSQPTSPTINFVSAPGEK